MFLALDTATAAVAAAVCAADGSPLAQAAVTDPRRHGEVLAGLIEQVRAEAGISFDDLTEVVVGVGPGPFTGLRVGIVTAQVFAFARGLPAWGVCSLDALADQAAASAAVGEPGAEFLVATDARRREVYWAHYRVEEASGSSASCARRLTGPEVAKPADLAAGPLGALPCAGAGPVLYPDVLRDAGPPRQVAAAALVQVVLHARAEGVQAGDDDGAHSSRLLPVEPLYLRRPDAVEPGPVKQVGPMVGATAPQSRAT